MTDVQTNLTYADYMETPDDEHCELLHGELVMFTTPPIYHQEVLGSLLAKLAAFEREYHPGQFYPVLTDVVLSDRDVVKPDILFVSNERSHILTRENVRGAPDLVVEILSPRHSRARPDVQARPVRAARRERVLDRGPGRRDDHGSVAGGGRL